MMRRKDREITDLQQITAVMERCDVCRLGLNDNGAPYIVPLCFGYTVKDKEHITLFFHSAGEGHKLDLLRKDNNVAFEMDAAHELFSHGSDACGYGMRYQCVMGAGTARLVTEDGEKAAAFDHIMAHYTREKLPYSSTALHAAIIIAVDITSISCKVHQ